MESKDPKARLSFMTIAAIAALLMPIVIAQDSGSESVSVSSIGPHIEEQMRAQSMAIMYGGAWKGPHAEQNVLDALSLGYRCFDTANVYPASYNETAMGVALEKAQVSGQVRREELFIQTKFSGGGKPDIADRYCADGPWDPKTCMFDKNAPLALQVQQSVQTSLVHLRVPKLDSFILHEMRQTDEDLKVIWRAIEEVYLSGKTASIGVSHAHDPEAFRQLLSFAKVKPSFVQNPIFAYNQWDYDIRMICREHGIVYQGYSLNHEENDFVYQTPEIQSIARRLGVTPQQIIVAFVRRLGLLPLVGPQDKIKMAQAITASKFVADRLTDEEVVIIENIATSKQGNMRSKNMHGEKLGMKVTNRLNSDVYLAWQTPDHSEIRVKNGMHVEPMRIAAGETSSITTIHRHGFYIWDINDGEEAPLYRHGESKRWVRRVSVNGFEHSKGLNVVVDESFKVTVVNMGSKDQELVSDGASHIVRAFGGSVYLTMVDGQTIEMVGQGKKNVAVRRADGDPQLLSLYSEEDHSTTSSEEEEL